MTTNRGRQCRTNDDSCRGVVSSKLCMKKLIHTVQVWRWRHVTFPPAEPLSASLPISISDTATPQLNLPSRDLSAYLPNVINNNLDLNPWTYEINAKLWTSILKHSWRSDAKSRIIVHWDRSSVCLSITQLRPNPLTNLYNFLQSEQRIYFTSGIYFTSVTRRFICN